MDRIYNTYVLHTDAYLIEHTVDGKLRYSFVIEYRGAGTQPYGVDVFEIVRGFGLLRKEGATPAGVQRYVNSAWGRERPWVRMHMADIVSIMTDKRALQGRFVRRWKYISARCHFIRASGAPEPFADLPNYYGATKRAERDYKQQKNPVSVRDRAKASPFRTGKMVAYENVNATMERAQYAAKYLEYHGITPAQYRSKLRTLDKLIRGPEAVKGKGRK